MNGKRMCQSYEIIDSRRVGDTEVVLGYSPTEVSPYVTWKCYAYDNFQGYNYGASARTPGLEAPAPQERPRHGAVTYHGRFFSLFKSPLNLMGLSGEV